MGGSRARARVYIYIIEIETHSISYELFQQYLLFYNYSLASHM
jgi:hypothetical protein